MSTPPEPALSAALPRPRQRAALRLIAGFETVKGLAAIAASIGLVSLVHHDLRHLAYALIGHYHLDPDAHWPKVLLADADWLSNADLRTLVLGAWAYAALRIAEGYGLWRDRAWAEWLAALSGALYLPFEANHLIAHPTATNCAVLLGNLGVVAYMAWRLRRRLIAATAQPPA